MKFTDDILQKILTHNKRITEIHSNSDIDHSRSHLNFSLPMKHNDRTDLDYYHRRLNEVYIYGRGTSRDEKAIKACSWVIQLPEEIKGNMEQEKTFFQHAFSFVEKRYGAENMIFNRVHYDEYRPHIHIVFCPITNLDHEIVMHKSRKTPQEVKLDSGRYEYLHKCQLDDNGNKIPIKNYDKKMLLYDKKLDANSVMNRQELKHFHADFQTYLNEHQMHVAVATGTTDGINFSVEALKEFTQKTGHTLDQVKNLTKDRSILEVLVEQEQCIKDLERSILEKNHTIDCLQEQVRTLENTISKTKDFDWESDQAWEHIYDEEVYEW